MLKRVLILLLCIILVAPTGIRQGIVFSFLLNQATISVLLCVERAKSITLCHGRCYLNKQLLTYALAQEQEQSPAAETIEYKQLVYTVLSLPVVLLPAPGAESSISWYLSHLYREPGLSGIFRPPIYS